MVQKFSKYRFPDWPSNIRGGPHLTPRLTPQYSAGGPHLTPRLALQCSGGGPHLTPRLAPQCSGGGSLFDPPIDPPMLADLVMLVLRHPYMGPGLPPVADCPEWAAIRVFEVDAPLACTFLRRVVFEKSLFTYKVIF